MSLKSITSLLGLLSALMLCVAPIQAQETESKPQQDPKVEAEQEAEVFSEADYSANSRRAAERDYFPVVHDPALANVAAGNEALSPEEPVIGLRVGKVAHAYPISVMGGVELVNDTIGELPVTVSW